MAPSTNQGMTMNPEDIYIGKNEIVTYREETSETVLYFIHSQEENGNLFFLPSPFVKQACKPFKAFQCIVDSTGEGYVFQ